jgi:hypothetical protein
MAEVCDLDPFNSVVTPESSDVDILKTELEDYLRRFKDAVCAESQAISIPQNSYGEIYVENNSDPTVIPGAGVFVQVEVFAVNGPFRRTTPNAAENHITVDRAGHYFVAVSASCLSGAGGGAVFHCSVFLNNGATELLNVHWHRRLAGGGGDVGSTSMSGIVELDLSDTLEIWVLNETNGTDIIFQDIDLSLIEVGSL